MKKILRILFYFICFLLILFYRKQITSIMVEKIVYNNNNVTLQSNEYSKKESYDYVKISDNLEVNNKNDILNVIYTILDSGTTEFTFSCGNNYTTCQDDIEKISTDDTYLSVLNNFVHPYNSYNKLYVSINSIKKVKIRIEKLYSNDEINFINNQLDSIEQTILNDQMTNVEKIKTFHDFVINNTVYDQERADEIESKNFGENKYMSHKANGVLINHIALCSGYTDLMAIFLNRLNVRNYKVSTNNHIWNVAYINDQWLHMDLAWDDPVTDTGENVLLDDFFLISTEKLLNKNTIEHNYDINIYKEIAY